MRYIYKKWRWKESLFYINFQKNLGILIKNSFFKHVYSILQFNQFNQFNINIKYIYYKIHYLDIYKVNLHNKNNFFLSIGKITNKQRFRYSISFYNWRFFKKKRQYPKRILYRLPYFNLKDIISYSYEMYFSVFYIYYHYILSNAQTNLEYKWFFYQPDYIQYYDRLFLHRWYSLKKRKLSFFYYLYVFSKYT